MSFELHLYRAIGRAGFLLHCLGIVLKCVCADLAKAIDAEFDKSLWEEGVGGGLWKVIFGGCCYCVLFNHLIHQYAISIGETYNCCACTSCTIQYTITVEKKTVSEPQKPPIKVKMKIGDIEFEIESQEDQIQTAVERILSTVTARLKDTQLVAAQTERQAPPPRAETCRGVIQKLWEESWFAEPKGLDDVHSELARRGFHYDRTAVAHALVDLVKDNVLTRLGRPRRYQYAQKRPPS